MTEIQAHEFLSKCESRLLWRKVGDENKVIEIITRNFRGGIILGLFWLGLSAKDFFNLKHENGLASYYFEITMITSMLIIALAMLGFSIWILVRIRQVRIALRGKI